MKKILVVGGTGFVGGYLVSELLNRGFKPTLLVRDLEKVKTRFSGCDFIVGDPVKEGSWQAEVPKFEVVINLTGQNIFGKWTEEYKRLILESRIKSTENIVNSLKEGSFLVNASAIGYYGDRGDVLVDETAPPGDDFLAKVCVEWEKKANAAKEKGCKVAITRFGIVLGKGGMIKKVLPVFKWGLGGTLGNGKQWFSWIHIQDLVAGLLFLIEIDLEGVFNFTSPQPVTNKEFTRALAEVLRKPAFFRVPKFMLKLVLGELAESILASIKAYPERLIKEGFTFNYPEIKNALKHIIQN
ncbi:TIGR01777 family oxidoreductase [Thermodesulfobacterium sp. TA1]|uniref:TIGR01777 family oxidoreductase n=1 Tax=Thermodesulfobacterium sp. TA1 TaxID=2234087 RepID=UPI00143D63E9|nr:TIGR01777 family oxidoreductase [Thermodesulfobacterium sp. TA1]